MMGKNATNVHVKEVRVHYGLRFAAICALLWAACGYSAGASWIADVVDKRTRVGNGVTVLTWARVGMDQLPEMLVPVYVENPQTTTVGDLVSTVLEKNAMEDIVGYNSAVESVPFFCIKLEDKSCPVIMAKKSALSSHPVNRVTRATLWFSDKRYMSADPLEDFESPVDSESEEDLYQPEVNGDCMMAYEKAWSMAHGSSAIAPPDDDIVRWWLSLGDAAELTRLTSFMNKSALESETYRTAERALYNTEAGQTASEAEQYRLRLPTGDWEGQLNHPVRLEVRLFSGDDSATLVHKATIICSGSMQLSDLGDNMIGTWEDYWGLRDLRGEGTGSQRIAQLWASQRPAGKVETFKAHMFKKEGVSDLPSNVTVFEHLSHIHDVVVPYGKYVLDVFFA